MIGNFKFNNIESDSFKLVCKSVKRPLLPAVKINRIDLPNVSGVYDFNDNEYSLRSISMRISYIGTNYTELRTRARSISSWLSSRVWTKLIINDEPDKYYLAKVTNEIDLESLWESGTAEVEFDCQPFAYSINDESLTFGVVAPMSYPFVNPGTRLIDYKSPQGSKSLITIEGSFTTLSLSMNGRTISYTQAMTGVLVIDNIEMEASVGGVNAFNSLSGDIDTFLTIMPNENTLVIGGTGLNITITIDFITMWI